MMFSNLNLISVVNNLFFSPSVNTNTLDLSNSNLAFLLLHEFNHIITNHEATEKQCDQFAIRWSRKLIKEGLI